MRTMRLAAGLILALLAIFWIAEAKRRYHADDDDEDGGFVFPGPVSRPGRSKDNEIVKSIQLAKKISSVETLEDYFKLMNIVPSEPAYTSIDLRFGGTQRSKAIKAKQALCEPELQVVAVKENTDPAITYFPTCVRVKRCGGCCAHGLLSCQPTATVVHNYQIHVIRLIGPNENDQHKEIVPIEEHTACQCDCRAKEKDCTEKQYYSKEECRCICKNADEEDKCSLSPDTKYWRSSDCTCQCRKALECATGSFFDKNLCSCQQLPISRVWSNYNYDRNKPAKPNSSSDAPVFVPLVVDDSRRKHKEDPEYK